MNIETINNTIINDIVQKICTFIPANLKYASNFY